MDKIILEEMQFFGYHGLFPEENRLGQRFTVDVELYLHMKKAGKTDQMEYSIDYSEVYHRVKNIVEGEAKNLIETVAELIATELLDSFRELHACRVKVTKPDPPIPGHYKSVAVEIYREKKNE